MTKKKVFYMICSAGAGILAIIVGIVSKDNWLSIITAVVSAAYTIQLAAGERYALLAGTLFSILYAIVSFLNGLYATALFFILYLMPVTIISFVRWGKAETIYKEPMGWKSWIGSLLLAAVVLLVLYWILKQTNDAQPLLDSCVFTISVLTGIWMMLNHNEFWILNTASCLIQLVMWSIQLVRTGEGISVIVLQGIAMLFSLIGLINWVKALRAKKMDRETEEGK